MCRREEVVRRKREGGGSGGGESEVLRARSAGSGQRGVRSVLGCFFVVSFER